MLVEAGCRQLETSSAGGSSSGGGCQQLHSQEQAVNGDEGIHDFVACLPWALYIDLCSLPNLKSVNWFYSIMLITYFPRTDKA